MKHFYLLLLFLSATVFSQNVIIPDPAFKAALLAANPTVDTNGDGEIQESEALEVHTLYVDNQGINDITGIKAFENLVELSCSHNNLTTLDVSGMQNLFNLNCHYNQLASLNVSGLINLNALSCHHNQLTSLDVSSLVNLFVHLHCHNNQLATLDVSNLTNLTELLAANNQLATIDITNTRINGLDVSNNPIETIFMKNGRLNLGLSIINTPQLQYICADEAEIANTLLMLADNGQSAVVNSYCSFVPGGTYNTIDGIAQFDNESDGCDSGDSSGGFIKININDGTSQGTAFLDSDSNYRFYTGAGTFSLTPQVENPAYFNFSPATDSVSFSAADGSTATADFCITPNGVHPDVEVIITSSNVMPGFEFINTLIIRNKGNQISSGTVTYNFDDLHVNFLTSSPAADASTAGSLTFNYADLQPFESRSLAYIQMICNAPTDTPAINIGDLIVSSAEITPIMGDESPADNSFTLSTTVVGSFDPNDITCLEGDVESPDRIGAYLHYLIRFENTGSANAVNVVVKNMIDASKFDISSLQVLDTSHDADIRITGNKAEFIFEDIQLEPEGDGHVLFKIKTKNTLTVGSSVSQFADIYFDYNFPVTTNTATTTFQILGTPQYNLDRVALVPNPATTTFSVSGIGDTLSIRIFDLNGRMVLDHAPTTGPVDVSQLGSGIYMVRVQAPTGEAVRKLAVR